MKYTFLMIFLLLVAASVITVWNQPDVTTDVPVLYWVTDPNPARKMQIAVFEKWLIKNGFTKPGDPTRPCMIVKVDAVNADNTKKIIQGVSGVGGDIMDTYSVSGSQLQFSQMGLLTDITDFAATLTNKRGGPIHFDVSKTFPALASEITVCNEVGVPRQVMFPCNVTVPQYWVNKGVFRKLGLVPPNKAMTIEEFETLGKIFIKRANQGKITQDVFFVNYIQLDVLVRSFGLAYLNETLTASRLDDPRYVKALEYLYKWTYTDRLTPTLADLQSASSSSEYEQCMGMFNEGKFGLYFSGRFALIGFRKMQEARKERGDKPLQLGVVPPMYAQFPNAVISTKAAAIYIDSKHKDMAMLFLAYLASKEYNDCIVTDADALPPNPQYLNTKEFLSPKNYPLENGCHEPFARAALEYAIPSDYSPFIAPSMMGTIGFHKDKFMNGQITAQQAARLTQKNINEEITRTVIERPYLQPEYQRRLEIQKNIDEHVKRFEKIEQLKTAGKAIPDSLKQQAKPIPLEWLYNPFYQRYYQVKGWAE